MLQDLFKALRKDLNNIMLKQKKDFGKLDVAFAANRFKSFIVFLIN